MKWMSSDSCLTGKRITTTSITIVRPFLSYKNEGNKISAKYTLEATFCHSPFASLNIL